ncbi:MAG: hypothetical protein HY867_04880 [Chloroflexi bacterium]|nr:hypothetical protein [Chloroflexota bacterium]
MKRKFIVLLSIVIVLSLALTGTASATKPEAKEAGPLTPGQAQVFAQNVRINVVFIGYDAADINMADYKSWLPATYTPIVRYPAFYGIEGRDMGLKYNFNYKYIFKSAAFNNKFFTFLKFKGTDRGLNFYQQAYNDQVNNIMNVTAPVLWIDAPTVENWLNKNLGFSANSYTIVFINWYDRPDFRFHVYTKTDESDPDTGYNFGLARGSRKMMAWGGSNSRLWFYDLSAGPEAWAGSYNVDDADLDGDSVADYRLPAIWEYDAAGYRDPAELGGDLGLVTRFVAIDMLFTGSPLYDPMATTPSVNGRKITHVNMMEDDPASNGTSWMNTAMVTEEFKAMQPYYVWSTQMTDVNPIDAGAKKAFRIFAGLSSANDCWNAYGTPFAQLFCYFDTNYDKYIPPYRTRDYVFPIHAFNTTAAKLGGQYGLLGFADDNWIDGTPSYVFEFGAAEYRALGYGFTDTAIHEGGHHFGFSHPHDGYDAEYDIDFGASGPLYFAQSGDESHTVMSYMNLTSEFGRFNMDNLGRWEFAGYMNWSNELYAALAAHPNFASVAGYVSSADDYATAAMASYDGWFYTKAAGYAKMAYWQLSKAAAILGVPTPDAAQPVAPSVVNPNVPREGDPIRFPDN